VVAVIWLVVIVVLVLVVIAAFVWHSLPPDEVDHRVAVELYAIHRRLDVAQFKQEVRRDMQRARRELDRELDG
jgi:uncharacterized protein YpmB